MHAEVYAVFHYIGQVLQMYYIFKIATYFDWQRDYFLVA